MILKVVFFGTPEFSKKILSFLVDSNIHIIAVVTRPDKPRNRSSSLIPSEVKVFALEKALKVFQPIKVSTNEFAETLKALNPDIFITVAFGEIIKRNILQIPRLGCINVHTSLLPRYRGAAPVQHALMNGDKETGVTIIQMNEGMDTGDILCKGKIEIDPDITAGELLHQLSPIAEKLLLNILYSLEKGTVDATPQSEEGASLAPKLTKEEGFLNWNQNITSIYNRYRAVTPNPGAWCYVSINGEKKRLLIESAKKEEFLEEGFSPGNFLFKDNKIKISCLNGFFNIEKLRLEGKKSVASKDFFNGFSKSKLFF